MNYSDQIRTHSKQKLSFLGVTTVVTMQQASNWINLNDTEIRGFRIAEDEVGGSNRPDQ